MWAEIRCFHTPTESGLRAGRRARTPNQARLGLALSGGRCRSAFDRLGGLATMTEFDLLRRAELLSAVSGGIVIGAT